MKRLLCSLSIVLFFPVIQYAKPVEMEIYAKVDQAVGNIAYTYKGELVYSNHPFYAPKMRVMHYDAKTKKATPYPNLAWNTPRKSDDLWFDSVLGIRSDSKGVIWILDMGQREGLTPKIVGWNTHTDSLEQIYYIPKPASVETSQLNDFLIDEMHGVFIIADEDIGCGQSRFGCWQCYVVRDNDKSLDGLMKSGYENIELYKKYREQYWNFTQLGWENTRDVYSHKTQQREYFDAKYNRDGMTKPKGVMLKARKHFFVELLKLNAKLDYDIIYANEIHLIQERWL